MEELQSDLCCALDHASHAGARSRSVPPGEKAGMQMFWIRHKARAGSPLHPEIFFRIVIQGIVTNQFKGTSIVFVTSSMFLYFYLLDLGLTAWNTWLACEKHKFDK